jgi:hypothetical protein
MNFINTADKTQASINAMEILGLKYVKRTSTHVYFDIPASWGKEKAGKLAKEFIRQTGIGVKMRMV